MNNSISGAGSGYSGSVGGQSFYNPNSYKKKQMGAGVNGSGKKIDKKKALPVTKKFPELKLMINGEHRNNNNSLSSDEDNLAVSYRFLTSQDSILNQTIDIVPTYKEVLAGSAWLEQTIAPEQK